MNINFSNIIKNIISVVFISVIAYSISSIIYFILPKTGIEKINKDKLNIEYKRFNIKQFFYSEKIEIKPVKQKQELLTNVKLQAIYAVNEEKGWIIIADSSSETHLLSVKDKFKGYTLSRIYSNYVIFIKKDKEYKVVLKASKKLEYSIIKKKKDNNILDAKDDETIVVLDDVVSVKRAYLNSYINNFDKIWKEISIKEVKDTNGDINGFKVKRIDKKSAFVKLGLKRGDIIKAINNIELKSYNDAFNVYKKINKIENLQIKILRNNREMELEYEIK